MFATKRRPEAASAEANRLIYEMEEKFDLMRLKARRADLEREAARLAEEEELLKDGLKPQKNCADQLCETPVETTTGGAKVMACAGEDEDHLVARGPPRDARRRSIPPVAPGG